MQETMVLEPVTCIRIGDRKLSAYYVGLTIFDCKTKIQTMMMYLILAFAQKSQQQPGSRRSQEVELVIWTDGSTNNKLERGRAEIFIKDKKIAIEKLCCWRDLLFFRGRRGGHAKGTIVDGVTGRNNCHLY